MAAPDAQRPLCRRRVAQSRTKTVQQTRKLHSHSATLIRGDIYLSVFNRYSDLARFVLLESAGIGA